MEGVVHPLQTSPSHTVAAPGRGRGLFSLTDPFSHQLQGVKDDRFPQFSPIA